MVTLLGLTSLQTSAQAYEFERLVRGLDTVLWFAIMDSRKVKSMNKKTSNYNLINLLATAHNCNCEVLEDFAHATIMGFCL